MLGVVGDGVGDGLCETEEGTCTLRAAIEEISAWSQQSRHGKVPIGPFVDSPCEERHVIWLNPGTYGLVQNRPLRITGNAGRLVCIRIQGTADNGGPMKTVIDGNAPKGAAGEARQDSVFHVGPYGDLVLDGVTVTQGHHHFIGGGAIRNEGDVIIYNSLLTKNSTHGRGGAIHNTGDLWVNESTLSKNWSRPNSGEKPGTGGAIANVGGSVLMYNVTVSGNRGGFDADGGHSSHQRDGGGGILNVDGGAFQMNNTTVADNQIYYYVRGGGGGGIYNDASSYARIWNTIIAKNYLHTRPEIRDDCKGTLESLGHNLVGNPGGLSPCTVNRGPGDQIGDSQSPIDPLFDDRGLRQNGGPTPTHALLEGSPAIDAGNPDPAGNGSCAPYDQRYLVRPRTVPPRTVSTDRPSAISGRTSTALPSSRSSTARTRRAIVALKT